MIAIGLVGVIPATSTWAEGAVETVKVRLSPQDGGTIESGSLHFRSVAGGSDEVVEVPVESSEIDLELPAESEWTLDPRIPGYWAPRGVVSVGSEPVVFRIPLLPTGLLTGRLRTPSRGASLPDFLYARVESPRATARSRKVGGGLFACPIADDRSFRCELPVAPLDLSLRVEGYVPHYRWDVEVRKGEAIDLEDLVLERGASLTGWVVTADGEPLAEGAIASLVLAVPAGNDSDALQRARANADRHEIAADGFFQFKGVPEGPYRLEIAGGPQGTAVASVAIRAGEETLLRQPLVLEAPIDLEIEVVPALDWAGKPWVLSMSRASDEVGTYDSAPFVRRSLGEAGRTTITDEPPGLFKLEVRDSMENVFWTDRAWHVGSQADARRSVEIPLVVVMGEVTLGDEPVAARIWFGGRYGERRIALESDAEGAYEGVLPEGGEWRVELRSDEGSIRAERTVEVSPDSDGEARVDLELPDTEIFGIVIDGAEEPVADATILIGGEGPSVTQTSNAQGEYRVRGLPPGTASLSASKGSTGQRTSRPVTVPLAEGAPLGPLELVLEEIGALTGTVLYAGRPVAGAIVAGYPKPHGGFGDRARTDAIGGFELRLAPSDLVDLVVSPPQGGLTTQRIDGSRETGLVIEVAENPGTLRLEVPDPEDGGAGHILRLSLDQVVISAQEIAEWRQTNGLGFAGLGSGTLTLPRMAPGAYTFCFGPQEEASSLPCTSGTLAPGGTLDLSLD